MANTKDLTNDVFKVLLYGPAGTGKTTLAATFPNPFFVDFDKGMLGLRGKDIRYITINNALTEDPDFNELVGEKWAKADAYTKAAKLINKLAETLGPDDTLVIDSLSFLNDHVLDYVLRLANQPTPRIQDWGAAQKMLEGILDQVKDLRCNLVLIAHDQFLKDETSGVVSWLPSTIGKLSTKIPIYFDEVYRSYADSKLQGGERVMVYGIETKPTRTSTAKSRLGLPTKVEMPTYQKLKELSDKLAKGGK